MQSGRQVYQRIDQQVLAAQSAAAAARGRLEQVHAAQAEAAAEEARLLGELARVRLDELAGNRIADGLDQADQRALDLLAQRQAERAALQQQIQAATAHQQELARRRDACLEARDAAAAAHQRQVEATMQRLLADAAYQMLHGEVDQLTALAQAAADKAQQAEVDRDRKRKPYEQDKLFAYLWRRRYRFPEYRAFGPTQAMDAWVARLCGYDRAHRDYAMLLEIPRRLQEHATASAERAKAAADRLAALERDALAADGAPELAATAEQRQAELDEVNRLIDAAEDEHDALLRRRAELDAGQDRHSASALSVLQEQLQREDVQTLLWDAAATRTAADDALVQQIQTVRQRREALQRDLEAAQPDHDRAQQALAEVTDLRRRFRMHDYDGEGHSFDSGFDLGDLLGGILRGALRSDAAWRTMRRHHRHASPSGGFGTGAEIAGRILGGILSTASRSSSRGGGGFFGGGGGGGFRSGGGFGGGGGGFRTGGGF